MDCIVLLISPWIYYFPFTIEDSLFLIAGETVRLCMTDIKKKIMDKIFSCPFITHCKIFHGRTRDPFKSDSDEEKMN